MKKKKEEKVELKELLDLAILPENENNPKYFDLKKTKLNINWKNQLIAIGSGVGLGYLLMKAGFHRWIVLATAIAFGFLLTNYFYDKKDKEKKKMKMINCEKHGKVRGIKMSSSGFWTLYVCSKCLKNKEVK